MYDNFLSRLKTIFIKLPKKRMFKFKKTGGIPFFISLISVYIISIFNLYNLPALFDSYGLRRLCYFIGGLAIGYLFADTFVRGKFSVFLHETKHAIVSGLVGNKPEDLKVEKDTGKFIYSYTKDTAKYNALIALAPYFLPLAFFFSTLVSFFFFYDNAVVYLIILGGGFSFDFVLNIRDVSPIQTDIKHITGGYNVGVSFIIGMNAFIFTSLLAFVLQELYGLKYVVYEMVRVLSYYLGNLHSLIIN